MSQVRVRMYRPGGIGDCFLLSFPKAGGKAHMLVDCGILKGTPAGKEGLQAAMQNVLEETGGVLDVLVVTHEHWDHISGFLMAREEFAQLQIGEVWLAWTEKRGNELADRLREQKHKAKQAVAKARFKLQGLLGADAQAADSLAALESLGAFYTDLDEDSLDLGAAISAPGVEDTGTALGASTKISYSTAGAMDWAQHHSGGKVRYLAPVGSPDANEEILELPGVDGVRIFVLGPPQSEAWIKKSDPSKTTPEVYSLASANHQGFLAAMGVGGSFEASKPFDKSFELGVEKARESAFFQNTYFSEAEDWRQIELDWLWVAERLALQLDSDTNNTSLVLAIELAEGQVLLFPGDAQVGNWLSWQELEWKVRAAHGELVRVKAEDLLKRTVLYKVGHHASHNATLRQEGLELMAGEGLTALIPVYEAQALEQGKQGWKMPFVPLLTRLVEKTEGRVFRADHGAPQGWEDVVAGKYEVAEGWLDVWVGESD